MKLPDYTEFIETLTEDKFSEIVDAVNSACIKDDPANNMFGKIAVYNMEFLRRYHQWLSEELDKQ